MAGNKKRTKKVVIGTQPLITVDPALPSLKDHPFFDGVEFQLLRSQIPPIVPDPHVPMKRKKSYSC